MASIRRLDPSLVNKIAAGEVIERPASVVKELVENALDADARRIDVLVRKGGLEQIRIVDDGGGIPIEELPLAVASHATSKLTRADDLFQVRTLGFRGEALASMAEISHLTIRSRPKQALAGGEIQVEGGVASDVRPTAVAPGTTVEVSNLFFNTPVRRKFLRSTQTEMGHLIEAFTRTALVHESVHFTLIHDERTLFDLPPTDSWLSRIRALCGEEIAEALMPVDRADADARLHGFVALPHVSRGNNRSQYFFLNQRHIRDRSFSHALGEAYRGLLMTGRYPVAFLRLELPPDQVDVNVHPTKTEVRFVDASKWYSLILGTLRTEFLQRDMTARGTARPTEPEIGTLQVEPTAGRSLARPPSIHAWPSPTNSQQRNDVTNARHPTLPLPRGSGMVPPFRPFDSTLAPWSSAAASSRAEQQALSINRMEASDAPAAVHGSSGAPAMQVCNRYLVTETEDGLMVIDQHALHERILYEELKDKVANGQLEKQPLLVPEPVELSPAEASLVLEHRDMLMEFGLEVEPFGGHTLIVMAYPAMLANLSPAEILRKIAEQLADDAQKLDRRMILDDMLHMIACKAAVKAGDRLTPQEVTALIDSRHLVHDAHHCPHGRPTTLVFTREELDRQFRRT